MPYSRSRAESNIGGRGWPCTVGPSGRPPDSAGVRRRPETGSACCRGSEHVGRHGRRHGLPPDGEPNIHSRGLVAAIVASGGARRDAGGRARHAGPGRRTGISPGAGAPRTAGRRDPRAGAGGRRLVPARRHQRDGHLVAPAAGTALLHGRTAWWALRPVRQAVLMHRHRSPGPTIQRSAFAGFHFPAEAITFAVRCYLRYGRSYRDGEDGVGLASRSDRYRDRPCSGCLLDDLSAVSARSVVCAAEPGVCDLRGPCQDSRSGSSPSCPPTRPGPRRHASC